MATSDLKLLGGWFSPFACRVQIALSIKGLDYENIEENLNPKSDLLLQSNPTYKKIPVLIHGDKTICESAIIVQYIDEVWKNNATSSILPSNAYDKAIARFWVSYIDDKFFNSLRNGLFAQDDESKKKYFDELEEVLLKLEEVFNKLSEGKGFFGGEKIGFIDIALGCYLSWLKVKEKFTGTKMFDEAKNPGLVIWAETFSAHPSVKGILPETDKLVEFAIAMAQRLAAAAAAPPK
ncbi:hypothetical protein TSUD_413550 [Trifolium subterraneum]|uniref:glutathione transferase n=1 Tax=Trifolium subterraneum TaxID=3900 RepID=A0A2Z6P4W4_TRISU|nr:hypothetical protein TSUD_413550 [Trifolium subterraneum]